MFLLTVFGVFSFWDDSGKAHFQINPLFRKNITEIKKNLPHFILILFLFIVLINFWKTGSDVDYLIDRLRIKLPFLVLPLAFLGFAKFTKSQVQSILLFLLIFMSINGLGIAINYVLDFQQIQDNIGLGHPMPTPRNHINFALITAISIIGGIYLIFTKYQKDHKIVYRLIIGLTIFLFLFIHFLSVRSGLVCLYGALFILTIRQILIAKNKVIAISLLLGIIAFPFIAYKTVPSLNRKISYMMYDLKQYSEGKGGVYADSGRLISLKAGLELFKEAPILGIGAGNVRLQMHQKYADKFPDYTPRMPHNQFVYVLTGTGILGLLIFLGILFTPLIIHRRYQNMFFLGVFIIFLTAFMLEHLIENAVGVAMFVFFNLLILQMELKGNKNS